MRTQIAEGFRWLWGQPFLRTCALIFAGANFTFQGIFLVFVVAAKRHGISSGGIGACIALFGACALARLDRRAAHQPDALDAHASSS